MISYGTLKRSEKSLIDRALDMEGGYVLDFSNRTIEEFFEDEFQIEFYSQRYAKNGDSKAKRLRTVLEIHSGSEAAHILRKMWDIRSTLPMYDQRLDPAQEDDLRNKYFEIISKLEGENPKIDLGAFPKFDNSNTLHALLQSIERDLREDAFDAAMDRLHLYCVMRFKHLLEIRDQVVTKEEPLNSLVGRYKNVLKQEGRTTEMSQLFVGYSISVFEKFNHIRNDRSLAHPNELLPANEARFIFDAVGAVLRFIKSIEPKFDSKH